MYANNEKLNIGRYRRTYSNDGVDDTEIRKVEIQELSLFSAKRKRHGVEKSIIDTYDREFHVVRAQLRPVTTYE